ncbi:MAG: type VI secretion system tip protein VgrG [Thermoanaerobaculia bacterium]|nr:type VI secretion system tip protein VgrG [Thermoanaerobaculia bacterium]
MGDYLQQQRKLRVTTPLGPNELLLKGFYGSEGISTLFGYRLEMIAENKTKVPFDAVLGQKLTIHLQLPDESSETHLNGLCVRLVQAGRDADFTAYEAEIVPDVWKLTRKAQSRIFQRLTVPEILKKVFAGFNVDWQLNEKYEPRDYCVQYRETDWNFGARLMEEEGIYFFFEHQDGDHKMIATDTATEHPTLPGENKLIYEEVEGGTRDENRIWAWKKEQEMRPGKYVLWDHCFELPHKHLEAEALIHDSVPVGKETHKLKVTGVDQLEVYDDPGEYAQRFDGIGPAGGEQAAELQKIFRDNQRTVELRMDEETTPAIVLRAKSNVKHMVSGYKFTLQRHFSGDGDYVVTSVRHAATFGADYRSGKDSLLSYENDLTCIPAALPYRPRRTTPKPVVQGSQTAVVVGPAGEEIFTDKYGRVKVQFHWDREGKNDPDSSCWIRVGTSWAGRNWGAIRIPRIGHEVIVDFLEGDPDQPIVVGSVYNADMMPPYDLPENKTQSGVKSRSSLGGTPKNFNEIRFEDKKGKEEFYQHAERNLTTVVEVDEGRTVGGNRGTGIGGNDSRKVGKNDTHEIGGFQKVEIKGFQETKIGNYHELTVGQHRRTKIGTDDTITVGGSEEHTVTKVFKVEADTIFLVAKNQILIGVGGSTINITSGRIDINSGGAIEAKGKTVDALAEDRAKLKGGRTEVEGVSKVDISSNGPVSATGAVVKLNA